MSDFSDPFDPFKGLRRQPTYAKSEAKLQELMQDATVRREVADMLVQGKPIHDISGHFKTTYQADIHHALNRALGSPRRAKAFVQENRPGTTLMELENIFPPLDWSKLGKRDV